MSSCWITLDSITLTLETDSSSYTPSGSFYRLIDVDSTRVPEIHCIDMLIKR